MSIEPAKEGSKTVYARMGIWYDEDQGMIHLTIPGSGWFHTTVSNNPDSKRYHPNLFGKLKRVLVEQGRWPEAGSEIPGVGTGEETSEDEPSTEVSESEQTPESDIEQRFHRAMARIYTRAKSEAGYNATRYLQMVSELGGLQTAKQLLHAPKVSDGFTHLWERGRLDLSVEALVLEPEWKALFTHEERGRARERLASYGYEE